MNSLQKKPPTMSPRGILRNKDEVDHRPFEEQLDRQEVVRNTILNSQMHSDPTKAVAEKPEAGAEANEHLKWDEINLYKTEQEKAATMKIDEPKTPYEGGFNPQGEYYQQDEDQEDDIPEFQLGKGEADDLEQSLYGSKILPREEGDEEEEEEEEEERPLTAEERHKKFEEMRKKHYHMKAKPLSRHYDYTKEPDE